MKNQIGIVLLLLLCYGKVWEVASTPCSLANCPAIQTEIITGSCVNIYAPSCCLGSYQNCGCRELATFVLNENEVGLDTIGFCNAPTKQCCLDCSCTGDPHCVAFDGHHANWVVCDTRNADCNFFAGGIKNTCPRVKYDNLPCVIRPDASGKDFCQPNPLTTPPVMVMYEKTYVGKDAQTYQFKILLHLAVYGSIDQIDVWDKIPINQDISTVSPTYTFSLEFLSSRKKKRKHQPARSALCLYPPGLEGIPISSTSEVVSLMNLDSEVQLILQCNKRKSQWGTNWDVISLKDPFFDVTSSSGFCPTGVISEIGSNPQQVTCTSIDFTLLTGYFKKYVHYPSKFCHVKSPTFLTDCKSKWCSNRVMFPSSPEEMLMSNYQLLGFSSVQACVAFVTPSQNFLAAVCAVSPSIRPMDPSQCESDSACYQCMNNVEDFPLDLPTILGPTHEPAPTVAPTAPCNLDELLTSGLLLKQLPEGVGGIQINANTAPIFALTDDEINQAIASCGCFKLPMIASAFPAAIYQVNQCFPTRFSDECTGSTEYNLTLACVNENIVQTSVPSQSPTQLPSSSPVTPTGNPTNSPPSSPPPSSPS